MSKNIVPLDLSKFFANLFTKDMGIYISLVIFLGYILVTVQQCTRYVYYRVDLVYLLDIRLSDICLGSLYILVMFVYVYFLDETMFNKLRDILKHLPILIEAFVCICLIAYALALRWSYMTIIFVAIVIPLLFEGFMYLLREYPFVRKLLGCEKKNAYY